MPIPSRLRTPLALSILTLLYERAMHPYEMQRLMRERGHDQVIKLKHGSLYATIDRLAAAGLIEPQETSREGRRPERTTYAVTDQGRDDLTLWISELVTTPQREYPWFGAVLAFLGVLSPDEVTKLLEHRTLLLEAEIAASEHVLQAVGVQGLPRLFSIEAEYGIALLRTDLEFSRMLVRDIRSGELAWPEDMVEFPQAHGPAE
jgi:DNA-binding PadR family transcriptional regulator